MPFFERRSLRLARFDYSLPGAYFITVVVHQRRCLLGAVVSGRSVPNDAGQRVIETWRSLTSRYRRVTLDAFVVMPNHIHGILRLDGGASLERQVGIPTIVGVLESLTTVRYVDAVEQRGWPPFERRLWQRSYYDRVIRDEAALTVCREYIATNPTRWAFESELPGLPARNEAVPDHSRNRRTMGIPGRREA